MTTIQLANVFGRKAGQRKIAELKEITKHHPHPVTFHMPAVGGSMMIRIQTEHEMAAPLLDRIHRHG